ncbi:MAG: hypothetical protein HYR88_18815 [Verrucomicrobia bacterium]|nr:hypothetical protein [Verrucomicrobiota bacterium]MBI3870725.1 hypothetical protein [Verrucomicrobiota bacterium]
MRSHWTDQPRWTAAFALALCAYLASRPPAGAAECPVIRWVERKLDRSVGASFAPNNTYRANDSFPADWRRVAILPMAVPDAGAQSMSGEQTLSPAILRELGKRLSFEVVPLAPESLRRVTGRAIWRADDPLPQELLNFVRDQKACQGLIFAELTQYHAYGPLQIGWKMKLIDTRQASVFWAFDQVFNSGVGSVATAARRYAQDHHAEPNSISDQQLILSSPARFGEYTLSAAFNTLPSR